ncbi:hypothetical protein Tco_0483387 [Tanacetum coccineum]
MLIRVVLAQPTAGIRDLECLMLSLIEQIAKLNMIYVAETKGKVVSMQRFPATDDELTEKEANQIEVDDHAIQTILIGLPENIYAAIDRCIQNVGNQNRLIIVPGIANQNGNGNVVAAQAKGNGNGNNGNQIRDCEEIEGVNANCILMENLQEASTSEEQYFKLLEDTSELHLVQQDNSNVNHLDSSMAPNGCELEQHTAIVKETRAYFESLYNNLVIEVEKVNKISKEKSTVSYLQQESKKLKSDFKTRKDELLDKLIQDDTKIKELYNILVKTSQSIQTMHMDSP